MNRKQINLYGIAFYQLYLQQYATYLEVHLIVFKATTKKTREHNFQIVCLGWGLNPRPFSLDYSALPSEPSHLVSVLQLFKLGLNRLSSTL